MDKYVFAFLFSFVIGAFMFFSFGRFEQPDQVFHYINSLRENPVQNYPMAAWAVAKIINLGNFDIFVAVWSAIITLASFAVLGIGFFMFPAPWFMVAGGLYSQFLAVLVFLVYVKYGETGNNMNRIFTFVCACVVMYFVHNWGIVYLVFYLVSKTLVYEKKIMFLVFVFLYKVYCMSLLFRSSGFEIIMSATYFPLCGIIGQFLNEDRLSDASFLIMSFIPAIIYPRVLIFTSAYAIFKGGKVDPWVFLMFFVVNCLVFFMG